MKERPILHGSHHDLTCRTITCCNACGGEKPADKFRACPTCRAMWRKHSGSKEARTTIKAPLEASDAMIRAGLERFSQFGNPANGMFHAYIAMLAESKRRNP